MEEIVLNLNDVLDAIAKLLEVIGGSAVIASIFPKAGKINDKGKDAISIVKKAVNLAVILYNTFVTASNVVGFNFLAAKNKSDSKE